MEQIKTPLVSVVLPVYNRPEKVCKTIKSILNQTFTDFELLVIDNASTDDTVERIKKISDSRIRLIVNERNMGQTYSLNRGLDEAKGKYIARIDSDDIMLSERLQKQISFLEKHDDYVLCGSWVRLMSDKDELLPIVLSVCSTDRGLRFMQTFTCGIHHPAAVFRKSTLQEYNIRYDEMLSMAEDYDMWSKLLEHGKGLNIPEVLVYCGRGEENDSIIHGEIMRQEAFKIRRNICAKIDISTKDKERLFKEIDLEDKPNKNILETCRVAAFLLSSLNRNFKRADRDYDVLLLHILIKIYSSCIYENERIYAKILDKIYRYLKSNMKK